MSDRLVIAGMAGLTEGAMKFIGKGAAGTAQLIYNFVNDRYISALERKCELVITTADEANLTDLWQYNHLSHLESGLTQTIGANSKAKLQYIKPDWRPFFGCCGLISLALGWNEQYRVAVLFRNPQVQLTRSKKASMCVAVFRNLDKYDVVHDNLYIAMTQLEADSRHESRTKGKPSKRWFRTKPTRRSVTGRIAEKLVGELKYTRAKEGSDCLVVKEAGVKVAFLMSQDYNSVVEIMVSRDPEPLAPANEH